MTHGPLPVVATPPAAVPDFRDCLRCNRRHYPCCGCSQPTVVAPSCRRCGTRGNLPHVVLPVLCPSPNERAPALGTTVRGDRKDRCRECDPVCGGLGPRWRRLGNDRRNFVGVLRRGHRLCHGSHCNRRAVPVERKKETARYDKGRLVLTSAHERTEARFRPARHADRALPKSRRTTLEALYSARRGGYTFTRSPDAADLSMAAMTSWRRTAPVKSGTVCVALSMSAANAA